MVGVLGQHGLEPRDDSFGSWRRCSVQLPKLPSVGVHHCFGGQRLNVEIVGEFARDVLHCLHNRMPAVLTPEAWPLWLGEKPAEAAELKAYSSRRDHPSPPQRLVPLPVLADLARIAQSSLIR